MFCIRQHSEGSKISLTLRVRGLVLQADSLSYEDPKASAKLEMHLVTDTTVR